MEIKLAIVRNLFSFTLIRTEGLVRKVVNRDKETVNV